MVPDSGCSELLKMKIDIETEKGHFHSRRSTRPSGCMTLQIGWLHGGANWHSGTVVVTAKAAGDRATYEWQYSQVGEPWIDVEPTRQARKTFDGLVAGRTYQFRVRSVTRAGRSDFGQVVSFFVD
jgi:hypothetical protein